MKLTMEETWELIEHLRSEHSQVIDRRTLASWKLADYQNLHIRIAEGCQYGK